MVTKENMMIRLALIFLSAVWGSFYSLSVFADQVTLEFQGSALLDADFRNYTPAQELIRDPADPNKVLNVEGFLTYERDTISEANDYRFAVKEYGLKIGDYVINPQVGDRVTISMDGNAHRVDFYGFGPNGPGVGSYDLGFFGFFLFFDSLGEFEIGDSPLPNFGDWIEQERFINATFTIDFQPTEDGDYGRIWSRPMEVKVADSVEITSPDVLECTEEGTGTFLATSNLRGDLRTSAVETRWFLNQEMVGFGDDLVVSAPLGTSVLSVEVTDTEGKKSTATKDVIVVDTTPPEIDLVLKQPNGNPVVSLSEMGSHKVGVELSVIDSCDPDPIVNASSGVAVEFGSVLRVNTATESVMVFGDELQFNVNATDASGNFANEIRVVALDGR